MARPKISLLPDSLDLELYAGDGVAISLTVTNSSGGVLSVDGEVTAQIRKERSDPDALADFVADLSNGSTGVIVLSLTGEQTAGLISVDGEAFRGQWDVQWRPPAAQPITLVQGRVECDADVTR